MRRAWAPLLFDDETLDRDRKRRDPVAPAEPSPQAKRKKTHRQTPDGLPIHSFETLIAEYATRARHAYRLNTDPQAPVFEQLSNPTPLQSRALQLIGAFPVPGSAET